MKLVNRVVDAVTQPLEQLKIAIVNGDLAAVRAIDAEDLKKQKNRTSD